MYLWVSHDKDRILWRMILHSWPIKYSSHKGDITIDISVFASRSLFVCVVCTGAVAVNTE